MRTLPLLLLVGCGDVSNAWILEDAEFVSALPDSDRHTVALESTDLTKGVEDWPELLALSYGVSRDVNALILQVLWSVDYVRTLPPDTRTEDGRRWGPYAWDEGVEFEIWVERAGPGRFDWGADAIGPVGTAPYVVGTHYAGDTVAAGDGQFTWTVDAVAEMIGDPSRGTLVVDYDNRDGIDLLVELVDVTDGSEDATNAMYAYQLIGEEGDFQYRTAADLGSADGRIEDIAVRTRWNRETGGRSDATVSGGSLVGADELWSQCWNDTLAQTYQADTYGWFTQEGAESDCAYTSFGAVDRL